MIVCRFRSQVVCLSLCCCLAWRGMASNWTQGMLGWRAAEHSGMLSWWATEHRACSVGEQLNIEACSVDEQLSIEHAKLVSWPNIGACSVDEQLDIRVCSVDKHKSIWYAQSGIKQAYGHAHLASIVIFLMLYRPIHSFFPETCRPSIKARMFQVIFYFPDPRALVLVCETIKNRAC